MNGKENSNPVVRVETTHIDAQGRKKVVVQNLPAPPSAQAQSPVPTSQAQVTPIAASSYATAQTKGALHPGGSGNEFDAENPPPVDPIAMDIAGGSTRNKGCCKPKRWIILILLVLIAVGAVVGTLVGLGVFGGESGEYKVETKWSVVHNCVYSYCWSQEFFETSDDIDVGESITEEFVDGTLTTTLKSVDGNKATFDVSSTVNGCVRTRSTTATLDSNQHGPWSAIGSCGIGGGEMIVTKAQVKIS